MERVVVMNGSDDRVKDFLFVAASLADRIILWAASGRELCGRVSMRRAFAIAARR